MNILLADDDEVSRRILQQILESETHSIVVTKNGTEAWAVLARGTPIDLGIFDVVMPEVDGLELLTRVRRHPQLGSLPVILCTALHDRTTVAQAAALAVNDYIVKPFTRAGVVQKVVKVYERHYATPPLDTSADVYRRLEIDRLMLRELLLTLRTGVEEWIGRANQVMRWQELEMLATRANALKGACLSVGALSLAHQLSSAELFLANCRSPLGHGVDDAGVADLTAIQETHQIVARVQAECARLTVAIDEAWSDERDQPTPSRV